MNTSQIVLLLIIFSMPLTRVHAQDSTGEIDELRQLLAEMLIEYDTRISALEERLAVAERQTRAARRDADEAVELAEQTAIDLSSGTSAPNTYNPAIGATIAGQYADVGTGWNRIPGFQPAGEIGTAASGFSLGEAEINLNASIDARFFGNLTIAIAEDDGAAELEFEEASMQTTDLPAGLSVIGGRFFSAAGYLNGFHFHTDDFADRPLPYQAFFGGRYTVDGVQARWVAPSSLLVEIGSEWNWGGNYPASANENTSPGAWTLFTNLGGDVGVSHSWQLGLSWIRADAVNRGTTDGPGKFTGNSDLAALDFVWKWAPGGNPVQHNLKLQGEFFRRSEGGNFAGLAYAGNQTGWYLQGVWQFAPTWRAGLRHDVVDADNGTLFAVAGLESPGRNSSRDSLMIDWSPSEFSRLRMQYTNDDVLPDSDNQWILQYIMSVGTHGSHQF